MKLVAFAPAADDGRQAAPARAGILTEQGVRDLAPAGISSLAQLVEHGVDGVDLDRAAAPLEVERVQLLAPLPRPGKIICVGLNYHDHCREQGIEPPAYPMLFSKFANAVSHPGQAVTRPRATERMDLECELAVVIGQRARQVGREEAMSTVFGYTILNDVTMRDLQREDRQWLRAKGSDGFAPIGPVLVTRDELGDGRGIRLGSAVNGEAWQDSTTDEMIFDVPTLVAFISRTITLEPGDVVATGTPAGVGHYQDPQRYLVHGDVMECRIEGIGALRNPVVDETPRIGDHAAAAGVAGLLEPVR